MMSSIRRFAHRYGRWMEKHGATLLRLSLGVVFLWFGALKFVPGLSPSQETATDTMVVITGGLLSASSALFVLAVWESLIGIGLLIGRGMRATLTLLYLQLPGTFLPLVLFPERTWQMPPLVPTLEGQFILKNLVLISAGIVLGGMIRSTSNGSAAPS